MKSNHYIILGIIFIILFLYMGSCRRSYMGWGYPGYGGWLSAPSFFYWGGSRNYHYDRPSVRSGSVSGSRHYGGGYSAGK